MAAPWSTGLCDCFSDLGTCCLSCWCPCIIFGRIAEILDKGRTTCCVTGTCMGILDDDFACIYSSLYRERMRKEFNLEGSLCGDCLKHCFCRPCALTQEYRELQNRGFDPKLGWRGNMERQQHGGVTRAPVVEAGMMK